MESQESASAPGHDPSSDAEDVALMMQTKHGDTKAFEQLVERHKSSVISTAYRMLNDLEEAHDIAQRVFIRVWNSAPRYEVQAKFTTWLYTITKNLVFNESRRRRRRPHFSLEAQEEAFHLTQVDPKAVSPAEAALNNEMQAALDAAMEKLPARQRMALVLRRFEQMTYDEIGEVMKLSIPSVKSLLFRARTQLREELKAYLGDEADEME